MAKSKERPCFIFDVGIHGDCYVDYGTNEESESIDLGRLNGDERKIMLKLVRLANKQLKADVRQGGKG